MFLAINSCSYIFLFLLSLSTLAYTPIPKRICQTRLHLRYLESSGEKKPSKVSLKFQSMVSRFEQYNDDDIQQLDNVRLKELVFGGRDALNEKKVLRAFEILYEDLLPVRFGGDILFNLLDKSIENSRKNFKNLIPITILDDNSINRLPNYSTKLKKRIIKQVFAATTETPSECYASLLFPQIDNNSDGVISFQEFMGWVDSIVVTDEEEVSGLFQEIDRNNDGSLSFEEFQFWTTGVRRVDEDCTIDFSEVQTSSISKDSPMTPMKTNKNRDRYLHMVDTFATFGDAWMKKRERVADFSRSCNFEISRTTCVSDLTLMFIL